MAAINGTTIIEKVRLQPKPGSDAKPEDRLLAADLTKEYVSSGRNTWYIDLVRALPKLVDDIQQDFGADIYERMMLDPQVASSVNVLKSAVSVGGVHLSPPKLSGEHDNDSNRAIAEEIAEFLQDTIDNLDVSIEDVLWDMLDALPQGNKVAELVYEYSTGEYPGTRIQLRRIHVKTRESISFVVDRYNSVIGILPTDMALGTNKLIGEWQNKVLPREKFVILTFRPVNGDPRGNSILRTTYFVWWIKQQTIPEWLKYLAQFATPNVIGYTAEGATDEYELDSTSGEPVLDTDGLPKVTTPEQMMVDSLVEMRNGSAVAFPASSKVDVHFSQGGGEAFLNAFDTLDEWITKSILHQTLATGEGQHQARAAAEVHQDILGMLTLSIKWSVVRMIRKDILTPMVIYNWGEQFAFLTPDVTLGQVEQQDFAAASAGVSNLARANYFDPSQLPGIDQMLGLPPRSQDIVQLMIEALKRKLSSSEAPPTTPTPPQPSGTPDPTTEDEKDVKPGDDSRGSEDDGENDV